MPIDEYKTQILLLHSEQSTLDNLSTGFGERYTVHCATSGSEALNTLVDTPINVLISAHDLPGMSGLEALREAKKRSPETIGILLAGSNNEVEALVGDEEVFQVVSGTVTGDGLKALVDNATRQMRLMALAESANDTAANPDELSAEHIIMETSENGSTIISDGTGRLPIVNPKTVSAAASVGGRTVDVLVLTKDREFLDTIKDSARGMHEVHYANTLAQADAAVRNHKVGVAVVDAAMVGNKVEQLTQHLRKGSSRLISIVAGRRDDGEMLMDLINRGKVYRFLLKPVSPGRARLAVEASVKYHLEAPDAAFNPAGKAAAAKPAAAPKAAPRARPKPAAAPKGAASPKQVSPAKSAPRPAAAPRPVANTPAAADPPFGAISVPTGESPIEDGLATAFSADETSFTETVTGLISSVGEKFRGDKHETARAPVAPAQPRQAATSGGARKPGLQIRNIAIAAVAAAVVIGGLFWFTGNSDDSAASQQAADEAAANAASNDALVNEARLARDAGQIFNPAGSNAIELFSAALAADPQNDIVAAELDATIEEALGMAETAMLESRLDDAAAAVERVTATNPGHSRLPFLTTQLQQMQLSERLEDARLAMSESRHSDAAAALSSARAVAGEDTTEIDNIAAQLNAANGDKRIDDIISRGNARLKSGKLLRPANDNALYYFHLALSSDPGNTAALQGLSGISSEFVQQATAKIEAGKLNEAEDLLVSAKSVDPSNSEIVTATSQLNSARGRSGRSTRSDSAARLERERQAEARRVAEAELLAEAKRAAEAKRVAEAELQAEIERETEAERVADAEEEAPTTVADSSATEIGNAAATQPDNSLAAAALEKATEEPATNAKTQDAAGAGAGAENAADDTAVTTVSALNRIKYVAPKYPRAAQRRNLSGWVDIVFTVTVDGSVNSVEIRDSDPGDTFVNSARNAVEKWVFEPIVENGVAVEKRAGVRMMFALE